MSEPPPLIPRVRRAITAIPWSRWDALLDAPARLSLERAFLAAASHGGRPRHLPLWRGDRLAHERATRRASLPR